MLRLAGASAAGGVAAALAGCTGRSSDGDGRERLDRWLYDPAEYGTGWRQSRVQYGEVADIARNEMYLNDSVTDRLLGGSEIDPASLDYTLQASVSAGEKGGGFPSLAVLEGSFGIGSARSLAAGGSERVGSYDGRELYRTEDGYIALDHGVLVYVGPIDRTGAESYLDAAGTHSFVSHSDSFERFGERVGVGTYTDISVAGDGGVEGYTYQVDGPTTTVRSRRLVALTPEQRRVVERRLDHALRVYDYLRDATFEYGDGEAFVRAELDSGQALLIVDPVDVLRLGY